MLRQLAAHNPDRIPGFQDLKVADQAKIRLALARRHVDPADVPETAKAPAALALSVPSSSQSAPRTSQKRSSDALDQSSSQRSSGTALGPSSSRIIDLSDEENAEEPSSEEDRDELYVVLKTKVVGIQYYHGSSYYSSSSISQPSKRPDRAGWTRRRSCADSRAR